MHYCRDSDSNRIYSSCQAVTLQKKAGARLEASATMESEPCKKNVSNIPLPPLSVASSSVWVGNFFLRIQAMQLCFRKHPEFLF